VAGCYRAVGECLGVNVRPVRRPVAERRIPSSSGATSSGSTRGDP
jgi:hypothetical protein